MAMGIHGLGKSKMPGKKTCRHHELKIMSLGRILKCVGCGKVWFREGKTNYKWRVCAGGRT